MPKYYDQNCRSLLNFLQITTYYPIPCFPMLSSGETNTNLQGPTFTRKSILFVSFQMTKPLRLLFCKHSLMLSSFRPVFTEIISSSLTLHIHLTDLASFFFSLVTISCVTGPISLPYGKTLYAHAEFNLPFAHKDKPKYLALNIRP